MARPFLKWVGGKTQLLKELEKRLPPCPEGGYDYVEPFLGGGALFFNLQKTGKIKSALLNDANPELILCYRAVRDAVDLLISELKEKSIIKLNEERHAAAKKKQADKIKKVFLEKKWGCGCFTFSLAQILAAIVLYQIYKWFFE